MAGEERKGASAAPGCLFGDKQQKVICRGSATHKYTSPKATQNRFEITHKTRDGIQGLDSRFRGNDIMVGPALADMSACLDSRFRGKDGNIRKELAQVLAAKTARHEI